jgi:signal peptidase II
LLSAFVIALDQWSKAWIETHIPAGGRIRLLSFFSLTRIYNRGAAFSLLNGPGAWRNDLFLTLALTVSVVIGVWIFRLPRRPRRLPVALGLILGGALGNAIDRLLHGHVIDFILLHYHHWYYPAFNVADSAITIGAVLFASSLFKR